MPRKPIHLELQGGKTQRQRVWDHIRRAAKPFALKEVTPGGVPNVTARDYLRGLVKAGILRIVREATHNHVEAQYKLVKDLGVEAPRVSKKGELVTQGSGNEAIWGAMQALGEFSYRLLAEISGATEQTVKSYCVALQRAGYLVVERPCKPTGRGATQATFRLLKSKVTGPRPPMITRVRAVYDPNIHKIVWQQNEDEVLEEAEKC